MEVGDEGWVQDVSSGDPTLLVWAITLPVDQVLETLALWSITQEASHCVRRIAIDDTGRRGGPGNRRQRAVTHGLNPRHMESMVNTEGTG